MYGEADTEIETEAIAVRKQHYVVYGAVTTRTVNPRYVAQVARRAAKLGFGVEQDDEGTVAIFNPADKWGPALVFEPDMDVTPVYDFEEGDPVWVVGVTKVVFWNRELADLESITSHAAGMAVQ